MLLLIPLLFLYFKSYGPRFTIHFATINTILKAEGYVLDKLFTIHFATINTIPKIYVKIMASIFTIHFATINTSKTLLKIFIYSLFTIHFATINTVAITSSNVITTYLQYTLLLLIRKCKCEWV